MLIWKELHKVCQRHVQWIDGARCSDDAKRWVCNRGIEGGRLLHAKLSMQFDSFQIEVTRQQVGNSSYGLYAERKICIE